MDDGYVSHGTVIETSSKVAGDNRIYTATIDNLTVHYWDGATKWSCKTRAEFTVEAPQGVPIPGHGNVFRLGDTYDIGIMGGDFKP